jgi:hypothetical protein
MRRLFVRFLVIPVFACVLASFASPATTRTAVATAKTSAPSDAQIDTTIRTKLAKSKIGKDGFTFHVQRGVVTWEGATNNVVQHKGSATRMARTAGAVQVVNNIQVSANAKTKAASNLKKAQVSE